MFSQACVNNSVQGVGGGVRSEGEMRGEGGVRGKGWGHVWQRGGQCVEVRRCAWWGCVWYERRPLQQTVHILLECILVTTCLVNVN